MDSHVELQVQEIINISQLTKRAHQQDIQVMVEGPGHVPLNEVAANVRLAKSLIGDVPYYVLGPLVTDIASGHDHIASAIGFFDVHLAISEKGWRRNSRLSIHFAWLRC